MVAGAVQVTNSPESGSGKLVDPQEIRDALNVYRNRMMVANQLRIAKKEGFDYNLAAAIKNKEDLRRALEHTAQKHTPTKPVL